MLHSRRFMNEAFAATLVVRHTARRFYSVLSGFVYVCAFISRCEPEMKRNGRCVSCVVRLCEF